MEKVRVFIVFIICIVFASCKDIELAPKSKLINGLHNIKDKGILFGHQDDLAYGIDWKYIEGESDVKRVSGDYPAIFGWELGGIELGHTANLDSVPFSKMKKFAITVSEMGGINTFSWHPYSVVNGENSWNTENIVVEHILPNGSHHKQFLEHLNKVGIFFESLTDKEGNPIPFVFRPWHEMDGEWFWWGKKCCSSVDFQKLFQFTIDYLKSNFLLNNNMLIAYSPDCNFSSKEEYLTWYPGDSYVDILGMDNYYDLRTGGEDKAIEKLHIIIDLANEKQKISALTETGIENVTDSVWYSEKLGYVLSDSIVKANLSYTMVWRNDPDVHYFFPYPGHAAELDAKNFLDKDYIWLLEDYNSVTNKIHKNAS